MSQLVKIRGLDRAASAVGADLLPRAFRVNSGYGLQYPSGVKASLTTSLTGANNDLVFTARYGGTWGNKIKVAYVDPSANDQTLAVSITFASTTGNPTISVSLATNGGGSITSTSASIKTAIEAHEAANELVTVANASSNTGAGVVTALTATALASGTDVGTGQPIYFRVNNNKTVVVDVDDAKTARVLKRNGYRFISLGAA